MFGGENFTQDAKMNASVLSWGLLSTLCYILWLDDTASGRIPRKILNILTLKAVLKGFFT